MSTYTLASNLTVPANSTLVFSGTQITVDAVHAVRIEVYGKLELLNSSITGSTPVSSLNIVLAGNRTHGAAFLIVNSSIDIHGMLYSSNSTVEAFNATIQSPGNISQPEYSFRMALYNSSSLFQNSTIKGLYSAAPGTLKVAGYMNYTGTSPVTNPGFIPLSAKSEVRAASVISLVTVTLNFSGNNPGNSNSLKFSLNGTPLQKYVMNSTGSVFTRENSEFSFNTSSFGYNLSSFLSDFSVYFNDSYAVGSNSTVWNLNITFQSSDTVHMDGLSYFSYVLSNSTMVMANSLAGINQQPWFSGQGILNPGKNGISLFNSSSVFFVSSAIGNSTGTYSPFQAHGKSTVYSFREITLQPESLGVPVTDYSYSIRADNLNSGVNSLSNSSLSLLASNVGNFVTESDSLLFHIMNESRVLPQAILNNSGSVDALNYVINVDGQNTSYTTGPYQEYSLNISAVSVNVDLPEINGTITTRTIFGNTTNSVKADLHSYLYSSGTIHWQMFYGTASRIQFASGTLNGISAGSFKNLSANLTTGFLNGVSNETIMLQLYCQNYTVYGRYVNISGEVEQYSSVFPSILSSYSWLQNGVLGLNVTIANPGNRSLDNSSLSVQYYHSGSLEKTTVFKIHVSARDASSYYLSSSTLSVHTNDVRISVIPSTAYLFAPNVTLSVNLNISQDRQYNITVTENGLPVSTNWGFSISGQNFTSQTESINLSLVNGTYSLKVLRVPGYVAVNHTYGIEVTGHSGAITVWYTPYLYSVSINVTGIPTGAQWSVVFNGTNRTFSAQQGNILLPNGTFELNFSAGLSYMAYMDDIRVNGSNISISVHFQKAVHPSFFDSALHLISEYRYIIGAVLVLFSLYLYYRFRDSVKICPKCFTTYRGFGRCPACRAKESKHEPEQKK